MPRIAPTTSSTYADEPAPDQGGGLVRVRLDISYDGTDFSGWAVQPGRRTVQGELQAGLARILQAPVALTVAGRTDAGVHATGQVAHADVRSVPSVRSLAGVLPADLSVRAVTPMSEHFDARFSALWRRYEYRICDGGVEPLRRAFVYGHKRRLDATAMALAARDLLGEHDFVAFCRRRDGATTIRTLLALDVVREGAEIVATVRADAFCRSMVRSLLGSLIAVGEGRRERLWPASLLDMGERASEVVVAPARGLTLAEVAYPPEAELAAQAERTRRKRD